MKKGILVLLIVMAVAILAVYLFIPTSITVAGFKTVNCPSASINRLFEKKDAASNWWPGEVSNDSVYSFQNAQYSFPKSAISNIHIHAKLDGLELTGEINTYFFSKDTAAIELKYAPVNTGINPVTRIQDYYKALTLKKQLVLILEAYKKFAEKKGTIYGIDIVQALVKDSSLISTKQSFNQFPTNKEIAGLTNRLKQYIAANGGIQKDFPMLNVNTTPENKYDAMVAIPLLKDIPSKGDIVIKKMVLGNILEVKVTGGPAAISKAQTALKYFVKDYNKTSPAIPFEMWVTDRDKEPDTTKWVTYLKYPVF